MRQGRIAAAAEQGVDYPSRDCIPQVREDVPRPPPEAKEIRAQFRGDIGKKME